LEVIVDIINNLNLIIQFFVPGYILISIYSFTSYHYREKEVHYLIINSIAISYLLVLLSTLLCMIPFLGQISSNLLATILAVLLGYILGRLVRNERVNKLICCFFNRDTIENLFLRYYNYQHGKNIGSRPCLNIRFKLRNSDTIYEGQLSSVLDPSIDPLLIVQYYKISDEKTVYDFRDSNYKNMELSVRYSDIEYLEVHKYTDSPNQKVQCYGKSNFQF